MAFDPNYPVDHQEIIAADFRNQFNALKALYDAQQATIEAQATRLAALETALSSRASKPTMGEFDPGFSDPPTTADLQNIQTAFNDLVGQLQNG